MDDHLLPSLGALGLKAVPTKDAKAELPPKDWPHAPVHRLSDKGIYFLTADTLGKRPLFDAPAKRDLLECMLLSLAKRHGWRLEAWAVFANHYHFVGCGQPDSTPLREFPRELHSRSAIALNALDGVADRAVWHNFWDMRLTYQHSYLARLNYVHQNAVKHGLAPVANQYPWCSAAWLERVASPAQVRTIYAFKADRLKVNDDS